MKQVPIYTKTQSTTFTHWTETLYICLGDDGDMSLKIWNVGDCGSGETFKSKETKVMSVLYKQIEDLCYEKEWEEDEVLQSIPKEWSLLASLLGVEKDSVNREKDAENTLNMIASWASKSAIYAYNNSGISNKRLMYECIQSFVVDYLKEHKTLPCGVHVINGVEVTFPAGDGE